MSTNSQKDRDMTPAENFRELYKRTAELNDKVSALLAPAWGSELGIIPSDHPLYQGEKPPAAQEEQAAPVDWQAITRLRERELKTVGEARHRAEAALARVHHVADLIEASAPWTASRAETARRIREALDGPGPATEETVPRALFDENARRFEAVTARVDELLATIARVRALHQPAGVVAAAEFGNPPDCTTCGANCWPCDTIRALDEEPS